MDDEDGVLPVWIRFIDGPGVSRWPRRQNLHALCLSEHACSGFDPVRDDPGEVAPLFPSACRCS